MLVYRYLLREVGFTTTAVTGVLFLIYISNRFVHYLGDAAAGTLPGDTVLALLALKALTSLPVLLPLSLYLGILLALGRLYKDSEMTALAACGIGQTRVLVSGLATALVIGVGVGWVSLYGAPWAQTQALRLQEQAEANADFVGITAGRFKQADEGNLIFYAEDIQQGGTVMQNVFAHRQAEDGMSVLTADTAVQRINSETGERFVVFRDGFRYEGTPGETDFRVVRFDEHGVRMSRPDVDIRKDRLAARSTSELWRSKRPPHVAEMQWRLAMPVSAVLLALVAVVLSRADPRQGRYAKLFTAILVYVVYNNLMGVARSWVERGSVPSLVGLWWVHVLLVVFFFILLTRQLGLSWVLRRVAGRS